MGIIFGDMGDGMCGLCPEARAPGDPLPHRGVPVGGVASPAGLPAIRHVNQDSLVSVLHSPFPVLVSLMHPLDLIV